jgi:hypothetical protein
MCLAAYIALATGIGVSVETAGWLRLTLIVASVGTLTALVVRTIWRRCTAPS